MNLTVWCCWEGSLDLWAFQDPAEVCTERHVHAEVVVTLEGGRCTPRATQIISDLQKALSVQMQTQPRAHQEQVSKYSLCLH